MIMNIFNMAHWPCCSTVQSAFLSAFFGLEMKKPSISAMKIGGIFTAAQDEHRNDGVSSADNGFILKLTTLGLSFLTMMLIIYYRPVVAFGLLYLACFYLLVAGSTECDDPSKKSTPDLYDKRNMNVVINHIHVLAHFVEKFDDYTGPKIADTSNVRTMYSAALGEENLDSIFIEEPDRIISEKENEFRARDGYKRFDDKDQ